MKRAHHIESGYKKGIKAKKKSGRGPIANNNYVTGWNRKEAY